MLNASQSKNYQIPTIYIVLGILWIVLTDSPQEWLRSLLYLFFTAFVICSLIRREKRKLALSDDQRMTEIVDKMNNLIIMSDLSGRITWVNRAFVNITGYTMQEALGKTHAELLYGPKTDREIVKTLSKAIENKEFFSGELVNYAKGGREYWSQFNLSPMFNAKGGLEGYISVENNIDDSKQKEYEIVRQHEKLQAVSWLNSHEIRKPVASILALTELLMIEKNEAERAELMKFLLQCTLELDQIIHQINEEAAVK